MGISRNRRTIRGPLLLSDLDPHSLSNTTLRKTNDPKWFLFPIRVAGPYVYGWDDVSGVLAGLLEMHGHFPAYRPWELNWVVAPIRRCGVTRARAIRDVEDDQREKAADGSGSSNAPDRVIMHATDVDLTCISDDDDDDDDMGESSSESESVNSQGEIVVPRRSDVAEKDVSSDGGAPGVDDGGKDVRVRCDGKDASSDGGALGNGGKVVSVGGGTGVLSSFASGFANSAIDPSSSSCITVFGEVSQAVAVLFSDEFTNMSEEDKARVFNSQDEATQCCFSTMSQCFHSAMLSNSRVARKRAKIIEGDTHRMQSSLSAANQEIESLGRDNQALEEVEKQVAELKVLNAN